MTPAERVLWQALRDRQATGFKVRRQHPVAGFYLDFAVFEARLGIELDGDIHDLPENQQRDTARTGVLEAHGWRLLRFRNEDVALNLPSVLSQIRDALARESTPLSPRV